MKEFLENSTIHGLSYISTTKRWSKFFWVVIVLHGFLGAIILINSSFQYWNENPIKTIIETFSTDKIEFPVVTVCPPKNTFTLFNYDLMMANSTALISKEKTNLLIQTTVDKMQELEFFMATFNHFQYKERFKAWYFGTEECFKQFPSSHFLENVTSSKEKLELFFYFLMYLCLKDFIKHISLNLNFEFSLLRE